MQKTEKPQSDTIGNLLDELAARYGEHEAVIWDNNRLNYRSLKIQADVFAMSLLAFGIKPGDHIALLSSNRTEWLIAAFAIAKVGGVTVAVSTFSTERELAWILNHSRANCVITVSSVRKQNFIALLKKLCPEIEMSVPGLLDCSSLPYLKTIISIDDPSHGAVINWQDFILRSTKVKPKELSNRQKKVTKDDICYILYTSGSTAEPKGVMLAHGNVIANGFDIGERQNLHPGDRLWFSVPLFWSFGSANALPAIITHGGCAVLQETFEPGEALNLIEKEQCTVFYGMVNMVRAMREHPLWSPKKVKSMRTGLTIGLPEDIQMMIDTLGAKELCNVYGSTETYGNAAVCNSNDSLELRLQSQGLPLPGMRIRVIDIETRQPLAAGNLGELAVAGYVTPGYFRSPELTESSFDSEGYFLTGDLGIVGRDGRIYFKGRLKEMIKIGGINVSPLEVEEVLIQHPCIQQAFVFGLSDDIRDEKIVAVIEPKEGTKIDIDSLTAYCRKELAPYKVPAYFCEKSNEDLPRTATGKINKPELKRQLEKEHNDHKGRSDQIEVQVLNSSSPIPYETSSKEE